VISKLLLFLLLLLLLVGKLGLRRRLQRLKPRLDRSVNAALVLIALLYLGRLLRWWVGWD
jgi:hypothetical protein